MLKFFRKNQQVFILFIFLYCILSVFSVHLSQTGKFYDTVPFNLPFLAGFRNQLIQLGATKLLFSIFTVLGLLSIGFYLVKMNTNFLIINQRTQFIALFYISVSSLAFHQELFSPSIIGSIFLLIAIDRVFGSFGKPFPSYRFLDAGILIALGSLFYFNILFFLPFIWISQITVRKPDWREFSYTLVGAAVPFLYIFSGYFLFDHSIFEDINHIAGWIGLNKVIEYSWTFLGGVGIYLFVMLIASLYAIKKYPTRKVQSRKLYQLFLYLFLVTVLIYLFIPSAGIELIFAISIPSSVLLSIYFTECRNSFINNIFFFILMLVPFVVNLIEY